MTNLLLKSARNSAAYQSRGSHDCTVKRWRGWQKYCRSAISGLRSLATALSLGAVLALCSCREPIIHNLAEPDANRLITKLHAGKIESRKERQPDGKWFISTAASDGIRALKYLEDVRVLRSEIAPENNENSILSTREERRLRSERLLAREIENSLLSISGILEAHVHLNTPSPDPIFGPPIAERTGSASAVVVVGAGVELDKSELMRMIAGATGIQERSISIMITQGMAESERPLTADILIEGSAEAGQQLMRHWAFSLGVLLLTCSLLLFVFIWYQHYRNRVIAKC